MSKVNFFSKNPNCLSEIAAEAKKVTFGYHEYTIPPKEGCRALLDIIQPINLTTFQAKKVRCSNIEKIVKIVLFDSSDIFNFALTESKSLYILANPNYDKSQIFAYTSETELKTDTEVKLTEFSLMYAGFGTFGRTCETKTVKLTNCVQLFGDIWAAITEDSSLILVKTNCK